MRGLLSTLVFLIGLASLGGVLWWYTTTERRQEAPGGRPPYVLPVTLAEVQRGRLEPLVALTGSVRSSEHSRLGFRIDGRVVSLEAAEGARVEAGSVLARLEDDDQRVELLRAEAALVLSQRELDLAAAGTRIEDILQLEAVAEQRRAEVELARSEVERNRPLAGTDVITKSRFDSLASVSKAAEARLVAAEQELAEARAGTRPEEIEIRRAQVALRQAEVEIARTDLEKTVLRSPFDASVVRKLASLGETVGAGAAVYDLVDLSRREVELEVPAAVAARLREGATVEVTLDEAPDFVLSTAIDTLVVFADESSRNFRALVRLGPDEDPELVLKPGVFVRARVELEALEDELLVPTDALRVVEAGTVVVRATPAPPAQGAGEPGPGGAGLVAEWVPVRVLASQGGSSAVQPLDGGLQAGQSLVVTGVDLAFPGVSLMPPMAPGGDGSHGGGAPGAGAGDPR